MANIIDQDAHGRPKRAVDMGGRYAEEIAASSPPASTTTATIADGAQTSDLLLLNGGILNSVMVLAAFSAGYFKLQWTNDAVPTSNGNWADAKVAGSAKTYDGTVNAAHTLSDDFPIAFWIGKTAFRLVNCNSSGVAANQNNSGASASAQLGLA